MRTAMVLKCSVFAVGLLWNTAIAQECDLDSLFGNAHQLMLTGTIQSVGKAVEFAFLEPQEGPMSGTSYDLAFEGCTWYLPVLQAYANSKYRIGQQHKCLLAFVCKEDGGRLYYIKEIQIID